jgi:hypothetical protein
MVKQMLKVATVSLALSATAVAVAAPASAYSRTCPEGYYGVIVEDPKGTPFFICVKA